MINHPAKRRYMMGAFIVLIGLLSVVIMSSLLQAGGVLTALYTITVNFTNTGTSDFDDLQAPFPLSGATLIDGFFISSDALNAIIHKGATDIPGMPPSTRIQVEGAVQDGGGAFTEFTTEAQSTTQNDVPLLPGAAAVGDAFYFGCDNPCRITTWDVDTAGVGTWTLTYEYWNGNVFQSFTNVDDRTSGFTTLGRNTVSWNMPLDWATRTTTGSSVNSYWGRARVSAFTNETTQPLGTRVFYENGEWWTWLEDLDVDNQQQLTLHFGGGTNLVSAHQTFPGAAGIITADAVTLEVTGAYSIGVIGRLDFSAAGSNTCILCKTGAITVNVSGSGSNPSIGVSFTGVVSEGGEILGIIVPSTGEQTIIIASDGTNAATFVNAAAGGMLSYDPAGIYTDNANNLTWVSGGGTDYFDSIRLDQAAPTVYNFETTFSDFNAGTNTNTQAYTGSFGLDN